MKKCRAEMGVLLAAAVVSAAVAATPLKMQPLGVYCGGTASGNASGCGETTPIMCERVNFPSLLGSFPSRFGAHSRSKCDGQVAR